MSIEFQNFQEEPIKWVEKLGDWSVRLSYSKETSMWMLNYTFNIKKSKEDWKYYITNQTPDTPENKWYLHNQKERYEINLASFDDFFKSLWKALDWYVWKPRPSLSEKKWERVFLLLWWKKESVKINQQKNQEKKEAKQETKTNLRKLFFAWLWDIWLKH